MVQLVSLYRAKNVPQYTGSPAGH